MNKNRTKKKGKTIKEKNREEVEELNQLVGVVITTAVSITLSRREGDKLERKKRKRKKS